jgi:membrane fusion protein (multidrug efflux system)
VKAFFILTISLVIAISASFVGYGIYLNRASDSYIDAMMASRAVDLHGVKATLRDFTPGIVVARLMLESERAADVIAQIEGQVSEAFVSQGQEVKRGQKLYTLVNPDIELQISKAKTDIAKAEAAYLLAESETDRKRRLAEKNTISKSELDAAIAQAQAAAAELAAAKIAAEQLERQKKFQSVTADTDGYAAVVYQHTGAYVQKGAPLMLLGDFSRMISKVHLPDGMIRNIAPIGEPYVIKLDQSYITEEALDLAFKSGFEDPFDIRARILNVDPPLAQPAPLRIVTWELDNDRGLLEPGLYPDVPISRRDSRKALTAPMALVEDMDDPKVYVSDSDSRLAVREVKIGAYGDGLIEILDGLDEGDIIITSNVEGLEPGIRVSVRLEED